MLHLYFPCYFALLFSGMTTHFIVFLLSLKLPTSSSFLCSADHFFHLSLMNKKYPIPSLSNLPSSCTHISCLLDGKVSLLLRPALSLYAESQSFGLCTVFPLILIPFFFSRSFSWTYQFALTLLILKTKKWYFYDHVSFNYIIQWCIYTRWNETKKF